MPNNPAVVSGWRRAFSGLALGGCALVGLSSVVAAEPVERRVDVVVIDISRGAPEVTSLTGVPWSTYVALRASAGRDRVVTLDSMLSIEPLSAPTAGPEPASAPATSTVDDPLRAKQWHLDVVGATNAGSVDASNVTVAILDTGVAPVDGLRVVDSASFVDDRLSAFEHGTEVASTLAAAAGNGDGGRGVTPGVRLLSGRVCIATLCPASAVARGIVWAVEHRADVINLSLGGAYSGTIDVAVRWAIDHGVSVVASAGNSSCTAASTSCDPDADNVAYPAALDGVIAVGAVGPSGAPTAWSSKGRRMTVAAPGQDIWMSGPGLYGSYASGTSFAAPIVAAVAARVLAAVPSLPPAGVEAALRIGAVPVPESLLPRPLPVAWYAGAGVVHAAQAVAAAREIGAAGWEPAASSSAGRVDLTWLPVPGATGYDVLVDGRVVSSADASSATATVNGLVDDQTYAVSVTARSAAGTRTSGAALVTPGPALAPPAITGTSDPNDGSGELLVSLAAVPAGADAVEAWLDGRALGRVAVTPSTSPSSVWIKLGANATAATLSLAFRSSVGGRSARTAVIVEAHGFLEPPGLPVAAVSDGTIDLRWNPVVAASRYRVDAAYIDRSGARPTWVSVVAYTTSPAYSLHGATNGATYHVLLSSVDDTTGRESPSVDVAAIPAPSPLTGPVNVSVEPDSSDATAVRVLWTPVAGADSYLLTSTVDVARQVSVAPAGDGRVGVTLRASTNRLPNDRPVRVCIAAQRVLDHGSYVQQGSWSSGVTFRLGDGARTADGLACTDTSAPYIPSPDAVDSGGFAPLAPVRVADTRTGAPLAGGAVLEVPVAGVAGVRAGARGVAANVTAVDAVGAGFLTVWPCGSPMPVASSVNYRAGEIAANAVFTAVGDRGLCVFASVTTDVVVDVTGTFGGTRRTYTPVSPARLVDTRAGDLGGRLTAGSTVVIPVAGHAGVPAGATAVTMNVTGIDAGQDGFVTLWPCNGQRPVTSNLNLTERGTRPNLVTVGLAAGGEVCLFSQGAVDLAVDLAGWWAPVAEAAFTPESPVRIADSRDGIGIPTRLEAGGTAMVMVASSGGTGAAPAGSRAVSMNVTVVDAAGPGYLTVWPCGSRPTASNLNYSPHQTIPNAVAVSLSPEGSVCVYSQAAVDVVLDVNGYWT